MTLPIRPNQGGYRRPFGCGWFIREYLLGNGPEDSTPIDPKRGAPQADINYEYKEALARCIFRSKSAAFSEQTGHPFGLNRPPSRSKSATRDKG